MPEEQDSSLIENPKEEVTLVVDLDKSTTHPKIVKIPQTKLIIAIFSGVLLFIAGLVFSYNVGQTNGKASNKAVLEKKQPVREKEEPGVVTVGLNEEVTVKSGITLKLEEAAYDKTYEKQKNDSKFFYENNASQSAYLDSDYFKNSNLIIKVALENKTTKAVSYSPSSFRLKDSDDVQYVASFEGDKQVYGLNPEEKTRTSLSYIVPTSEKSFRIIYENAIIEFSLK